MHLLRGAPELAVAKVLRQTLESTTAALMAADPGIFSESPPWVAIPQSTRIAERIIELARQLTLELVDYQRAVERALDRQRRRERELRNAEADDIPF